MKELAAKPDPVQSLYMMGGQNPQVQIVLGLKKYTVHTYLLNVKRKKFERVNHSFQT